MLFSLGRQFYCSTLYKGQRADNQTIASEFDFHKAPSTFDKNNKGKICKKK